MNAAAAAVDERTMTCGNITRVLAKLVSKSCRILWYIVMSSRGYHEAGDKPMLMQNRAEII